jgi:alkanesulfonate monooxygenase SsuD/methylene tetrahydromethanopterin reductase-like flavin-dependent oxidoreductase (luciferase family)
LDHGVFVRGLETGDGTLKFDASLSPVGLKDVPAIARAAEEIGFDALWTQETQHDPFLPCALIAEHTARLHSGTAVAVSFARSPANIAYTAWDLAAQSGGRFILGLGTQVKAHIERRFGQPWPASPVKKLREQIEVTRAFWDCWQNGTKLNYRGEYYKVTLMSPFFQPAPLPFLSRAPEKHRDSPGTVPRYAGYQGRCSGRSASEVEAGLREKNQSLIPIYIAGVNTGLAKLAGELCDGFHAHPFHSVRYLREVILPAIEEGIKKEKRRREDISVAISTFVATTPEEMNAVRAQVAFYASTPSYRPVMDLHGWTGVAEKLSAHASRGAWAAMPMLITDEMLNEFCLVTEESKLAEELNKRYQGVADRLAIYTPFVPGEKDEWWKKLVKEFNE